MATNDGGPAFPRPISADPQGFTDMAQEGMSLRDWFAGMICNGIVAATAHTEAEGFIKPEAARGLGDFCYHLADQMLNARKPLDDASP